VHSPNGKSPSDDRPGVGLTKETTPDKMSQDMAYSMLKRKNSSKLLPLLSSSRTKL
jgi:hypothetical protein